MSKGTKVQAIRHHSFAGKEYEPGDTYVVNGDAHQTTEQYLDSLQGAGLAKVQGDDSGPNFVDEVGSEPAKSTAVAPLSTENIQQPEQTAEPAKPSKAKADKSSASKRSSKAKK